MNMTRSPGGGGGYSDIFIHTLAQAILWGFKILNFSMFWVFQKNEYFGGMKILLMIWGFITKFDYI